MSKFVNIITTRIVPYGSYTKIILDLDHFLRKKIAAVATNNIMCIDHPFVITIGSTAIAHGKC